MHISIFNIDLNSQIQLYLYNLNSILIFNIEKQIKKMRINAILTLFLGVSKAADGDGTTGWTIAKMCDGVIIDDDLNTP